MSELLKWLSENSSRSVGLTIAAFSLATIIAPHLLKVWEVWRDARSGKRAMESEKQRLEILKLRCEIQALTKEHQLAPAPDLIRQVSPGDTLMPGAEPRMEQLSPPWPAAPLPNLWWW